MPRRPLLAAVLCLLAATTGCTSGSDAAPTARPAATDVEGYEPPAPRGRPCGTVTDGGAQRQVFVLSDTPTCAEGTRLLQRYLAAPDKGGNAQVWTSPDGWDCASPTSGRADVLGLATDCTRGDERVVAR